MDAHGGKDGTPFPAEISSVVYHTASGEEFANVTLRDLSGGRATDLEGRLVVGGAIAVRSAQEAVRAAMQR